MLSRRDLALLAALTLAWGLNWPIMKFSLRELPPLWFRAATMAGGAALLAAFYAARGARLAVPAGDWRAVLLLGALNVLGWHTFTILGVAELSSGRAAVLGFTMPTWTVLFALALYRERLTRRQAAGVALAALAVLLLAWTELGALAGRPLGIAWMQLAAACWGLGTVLMRRLRYSIPTEALTVWMMGLSSVVLCAVAATLEPAPDWSRLGAGTWWAIAWSVAINYGVSQIIWFGLARKLPPAASSLSIVAVPLIGLAGAQWIVAEAPRPTDWLAATLIVGALLAILWRR